MDATSDRDFVLEYLQALTLIALHASRFAEEITLYATAEFGFVELPEAFSTGSSAMPQKKNPDLTELVRAKVARINGAAQTVTMLLKGLPLAYNKDLQETPGAASFCRGRRCGADDCFAGQVYCTRCASTRIACATPARPAFSMPWPPPPTSCTREFPFARRTRKLGRQCVMVWRRVVNLTALRSKS